MHAMATAEAARAAAREAASRRAADQQGCAADEAATLAALRSVGLSPAFANGITNALAVDFLEKPETDQRQYFFFTLRNGLRCIVARDLDASSLSAAALTVHAGSIHEPKDIPGLAHFCEHMVVHGSSSAYSFAEGSFAEYLKQHGGTHNASTTTLQTSFAFEIPGSYFEGAIMRFSRLFSSPFFVRACGKQELNAIEAEHSMNVQVDFRRQWAVLLTDVNPMHPYHWGSGCKRSLDIDTSRKSPGLHRLMEDFHASHYTADNMTLAVVGSQSIADLAMLVLRLFSGIPRERGGRLPLVVGDELPFLPDDFRGHIYMMPIKELRQVRFSWLLPWQVSRWRTKPSAYATYLLGHEGPHGCLAALRRCGLAWSCSVACHDYHGACSTFEIAVDLAEGSVQDDKLREIGAIVFAYIAFLQDSTPQRWVFDEYQKVQSLEFRFAYSVKPYTLVQDVASGLQHYPPEKVLSAERLLHEFDVDGTAAVLAALKVSEARLWIIAGEVEESCTSVEPWYGARFSKLPEIVPTLRGYWMDVEAGGWKHEVKTHKLQLPVPNRFLPTGELLSQGGASNRCRQGASGSGFRKLHLGGQPFVRAWCDDDAALEPLKAAATVTFHCPFTASGCDGAALTLLFCRCIQEELNEACAFEAHVAGMMYKLEPEETGFTLQLLGFTYGLHALACAISRCMVAFAERDVSDVIWNSVRDQQERHLKDIVHGGQPYVQAAAAMEEFLGCPSRTRSELLAVVEAMRVQKPAFSSLTRELFSGCLVEALIVGDIEDRQALELLQSVVQPLHACGLEQDLPRKPPARGEAILPESEDLIILDLASADASDPNNAVLQALCCIDSSLENEALCSVFMAAVKPMFFTEMRAKQQLGYFVASFLRVRTVHLSCVFVVQTGTNVDEVLHKIDDFLTTAIEYVLLDMSEIEFRDYREGVVMKLQETPRNMWDVLVRSWQPIQDRSFDFSKRERRLEFLQEASLATFRSFVRQVLLPARRVAVLVRSGSCLPEDTRKPRPPRRGLRLACKEDIKRFQQAITWKLVSDPWNASDTTSGDVVLPSTSAQEELACTIASDGTCILQRRADGAHDDDDEECRVQ